MVFNDTMKLGDGKETVEIIHFPHAHTDGDAVVHFKKADIYHMGDIFVTYIFFPPLVERMPLNRSYVRFEEPQ
jgi:cyclase